MLSVIIETRNDEEALARTLSALVSAAVDGIVREVVICDRGSSDQTHLVADQAGCIWLGNSDIRDAIRRARSEWLLVLAPGAILRSDWIEMTAAHLATSARPARYTRERGMTGPIARVFARRSLTDGLVISKRQAIALAAKMADAAQLARGVSSKRLTAEISFPRPRR